MCWNFDMKHDWMLYMTSTTKINNDYWLNYAHNGFIDLLIEKTFLFLNIENY